MPAYRRLPTSALSVAAVLALHAGPGCKGARPTPEGADFLAAPAAPAAPAGPVRFEGAGVVLLRDGDVAGWRLKAGPDYYDGATLYEAINGAGAAYVAYGFQQMAKADYAPEGLAGVTEDVVVEAYRMKTPLGAFGKYSEERSSCDPPGADPGPGCSRGSDRILHKGEWFVKVTTYDDSEAAVRELRRVAEGIARRTPGEIVVPPGATRLPEAGRRPNSVVYRPAALLGIDALGDGFQADYEAAGARWSLFVKEAGDAGRAAEVLAGLTNAAAGAGFAKAGAKPEAVAGLGDEALAVETAAGWLVAARRGGDVAGGVEFASREAAIAAAAELLTPGPTTPQ